MNWESLKNWGTSEAEFSNNQYTVVVPVEFEEADAEFEYVLTLRERLPV